MDSVSSSPTGKLNDCGFDFESECEFEEGNKINRVTATWMLRLRLVSELFWLMLKLVVSRGTGVSGVAGG